MKVKPSGNAERCSAGIEPGKEAAVKLQVGGGKRTEKSD